MAIVKVINKSKNNLPQYETIGSAGMDVRADIAENMELAPMQRALVPTGLFVEIPQGYEMQVRPRSGLAIKKGITLVNSPGTIDSDYRGEIKVIVINLSTESQIVEPAERIAQLVVAKYEKVEWESSEALAESDRGAGGFGSTGKN
ncbi:MAG: dUTP diphosphatase [Saprospiraceae bacterium]|jgi:dUTP pyrophosphatase|nr:dUTP diphosphatase [Saprospiraceae bacterium]